MQDALSGKVESVEAENVEELIKKNATCRKRGINEN